MKYFYAPIFNEPQSGLIMAGKDDGAGVVSAGEDMIPGMKFPLCDQGSLQRFVVETPDTFETLDGWTAKTKEEINIDYPGLIP